MHRLALMVLVLAVLAAGCGDDNVFGTTTAPSTTGTTDSTLPTTAPTSSSTTEPPSTTSTTSTTSTSTTSTTTTSTTTTTAPETVYLVDPAHFFPPPFPGSGDAHGSGCVTPGFDALPNGVWFGFAEGVGGGHLTFDLACFFTGTLACEAQIEDGFAADEATASTSGFATMWRRPSRYPSPRRLGSGISTPCRPTSPPRRRSPWRPGPTPIPSRTAPGILRRVAVRERRPGHRDRRAVPALRRRRAPAVTGKCAPPTGSARCRRAPPTATPGEYIGRASARPAPEPPRVANLRAHPCSRRSRPSAGARPAGTPPPPIRAG